MFKLSRNFSFESDDFLKPSVVVLVLANLLPLYGVLFLDWKVFPIIFLFWIENVIIGVINVFKMLVVSSAGSGKHVAKIFIIPFFCVHYGIFTLVHGIFVFVLFGEGINTSEGFPLQVDTGDFQLQWAVLALAISHGVSFVINYIKKGEYKRSNLNELMFQPYSRVMILHLTIIAGGWIIAIMGAPAGGLVLLIMFKITIDILAHLIQHKKQDVQVKPVAGTS